MSRYESLDARRKAPSFRFSGVNESITQENVPVHYASENSARWSHVDNLDEFFTRVYQFHQRHGFFCMVLSEALELFQFIFVVAFSAFLSQCVDYPVLFKQKLPPRFNSTPFDYHKVALIDAVYCCSTPSLPVSLCLIVASLFWLHRAARVFYHAFQYWETRNFFLQALGIATSDLDNLTWHDVLQKLCAVQKEQQLCIHKQELSELDIYQRILRHKNYIVAMVNKKLLPPQLFVPFLGDYVFFTNGFKMNLELIMFWGGPWTPWQTYGQIKPDYKRRDKRLDMIDEMRKVVLWFGLANLILAPVICVWQFLYSFFNYAELVKREPSFLGARKWSIYGRYFFRHFNELDHELEMRLNRGYRPSSQYMDLFVSNVMELIAKNVAFFVGALLAVLLLLTAIDEDVIQVEHVLTAMTAFGLIIVVCRAFISDENLVWCPEILMKYILAHVHYVPDNWIGNAHTERVRSEFSRLFQYKVVFLIEELLSPLLTPFVLLFWMRPRVDQFVDFFRSFSVEVPGLGDVCSFAQMDVRRHGNPTWQAVEMSGEDSQLGAIPPTPNQSGNAIDAGRSAADVPLIRRSSSRHLSTSDLVEQGGNQEADFGKTELSLIHFTVTNPFWSPPQASDRFLTTLRDKAAKDAEVLRDQQQNVLDNPLAHSVSSLTAAPVFSSSIFRPQAYLPPQSMIASHQGMFGSFAATAAAGEQTLLRGRLARHEGPLECSGNVSSMAASQLQQSMAMSTSGLGITHVLAGGGLERPWSTQPPKMDFAQPLDDRYTSFRPLSNAPTSNFFQLSSTAGTNGAFEGPAAEMSLSVLYMHELHRRRVELSQYGSVCSTARQPSRRETRPGLPTQPIEAVGGTPAAAGGVSAHHAAAAASSYESQRRLWEVPETQFVPLSQPSSSATIQASVHPRLNSPPDLFSA